MWTPCLSHMSGKLGFLRQSKWPEWGVLRTQDLRFLRRDPSQLWHPLGFYMLELSNIWHDRLGHINYNTICRLINLELLLKFYIDLDHKCKTCVKSKLTRSHFNYSKKYITSIINSQ